MAEYGDTESLVNKELESIIREEISNWKNEIEKLKSQNVDYLSFEDFLKQVQFLEQGMFQSIQQTMQSCVAISQRNEKREQLKEINTDAFKTDPWRNMYFGAKDMNWHLINAVTPIYTVMISLDDAIKEKAYQIIKGYKNVADSKQEYEYKEKMIDKVTAFSEKQLELQSKKDNERWESMTKTQRESSDRIESLIKTTLTEMKNNNEDSFERLQRHYSEMRKRDLELIETIAEKFGGTQVTTIYEDKKKKKESREENPVEKLVKPEKVEEKQETAPPVMSPVGMSFSGFSTPQNTQQIPQQQLQQQQQQQQPQQFMPGQQSPEDIIAQLYNNGRQQPLEIAVELKKQGISMPMSKIAIIMNSLKQQGKI